MNRLTFVISTLSLVFVMFVLIQSMYTRGVEPGLQGSMTGAIHQAIQLPENEPVLPDTRPVAMQSIAPTGQSLPHDMSIRSADYNSGDSFEDDVDPGIDEPVDVTAVLDLLADPDPAVRMEAEALLGLWQSEEWADTSGAGQATEGGDFDL